MVIIFLSNTLHLIKKEMYGFSHARRQKINFVSFFLYIDKSMKRGRVPKGFLSSNTAYMLVYKKLTTDWRTNATKKVKLKKSDSEVSCDIICLEKLTVKEKSDTLDETKLKHDVEDAPLSQEENSLIQKEKNISILDSENITEKDESTISQKTDTLTADETTETVASTNGCKDMNDSTVEQLQNKVHCLKQPVVKVVKLDYKRLNGDAHRAMSCGERDFYEEVSFLLDINSLCSLNS